MSIASSKASGSREVGDLGQRFEPQLRVAVALHAGEQEAAAQLLGPVVLQHRLRPPPALRVDPGAGQRRPDVLLGVVEVLDRDPPDLPFEHLACRFSSTSETGTIRRSTRTRRPRPRRTGPTTIAPPR